MTNKKSIKVVMLPTEKQSRYAEEGQISAFKDGSALQLISKQFASGHPMKRGAALSHYIYITVSQNVEPIKDGDWVFCLSTYYNNSKHPPEQYINPIRKWIETDNCKSCRKIIATTDPKLKLKVVDYNARKQPKYNPITEEFSGKDRYKHISIPQLQQSFLKEFVANPDREWEVEYETTYDCLCYNSQEHKNKCGGKGYEVPCEDEYLTLKLNQDNTVNITAITSKLKYQKFKN